jgi:hypothetical protein
MKKILLSLSILFSVSVNAQLPDGSVAPDFTLTDITGQSHNLYTYLNQGKTVFIDVSATWCGPCWNFHNSGTLKNLWVAHGPIGGNGVNSTSTNDVIVLFIEGDGQTTTMDLHGYGSNTRGNWVEGVKYPVIDPNATTVSAFNASYQIGFFPTIYRVCPNRIITEVGQQTATQLYSGVSSCGVTASMPRDVAYAGYEASTSFCSPGDYQPKVKIQNNGLMPLTEATIFVKQNGQVISTGTYSGNLTTYATASVECSSISNFNGGNVVIEVITENDGVTSNNVSIVTISPSLEITNKISLKVVTDGYASETSWNIRNSSNQIVTGTSNPTLANNQTYNLNYTLAEKGCYTYNIIDSYGDGLIGAGSIDVKDSEGKVIINDRNYGYGRSIAINVTHIVGQPELASSIAPDENNTITLCAGETVVLSSSAPSGNAWSNGETTKSITVSESGTYSVVADDMTSNEINVVIVPELALVSSVLSAPSCNGNADGSIEFTGNGSGMLYVNNNEGIEVELPYVISDLGTGSYDFILKNGNCSSNKIEILLQDQDAKIPTIVSGETSVCFGSTVTLEAVAEGNVVWSNGEVATELTVSESGIYFVTYTDENGCIGTSESVEVKINPLPIVSAGEDRGVCSGKSVALNATGALSYVWDNAVINGVAFTPTETKTYTVIGTDVNGCVGESSVTLELLESPIVSAGDDVTVCKGSSVALSASGADTYAWSGGISDAVPFTVMYPVSFTVTGISTNGCMSSDQVAVKIHPVPTATFTVPDQICKQIAEPLTLSATPEGGVFTGSAVSNGLFNPNSLAVGVYLLSYTTPADANGCTNKVHDFIRVISCLGIEENELDFDLTIFPNPTKNTFQVKGSDSSKFEELTMIDVAGRVVAKWDLNQVETMDVSTFNEGTYLLYFKGIDLSTTKKIQISK